VLPYPKLQNHKELDKKLVELGELGARNIK
jgi:hypothetical protein